MTRWVGAALVVLVAIGSSGTARAGGYDTPMLYSARHMGMGGAANAYVNDPSALFHNPAGLGHIKGLTLLADFSLLVGGIQSSPQTFAASIESEPVIAPFFLLGAGYRVTDYLTLGLAVYPVASASAKYEYQSSSGQSIIDSTQLLFIESTLGAAVNIEAARLRIGAGYRVTFLSFKRTQSFDGADQLAFDMAGWNFAGFRAGIQWTAIPGHLSMGFSYRHKTVTEVTQDKVTIPALLGGTATDGSAEFTLPSRFIWGVRGDYMNIGLAFDVEYALNSQNSDTTIQGTVPSGNIELANIFEWDDAVTLRMGAEYRIQFGEHAILPRLGFIYDARTSKKKYPTAFGTPPAPTYVLTFGAGYESGPYRINVAYAYRFGSTEIADNDLANPGANPDDRNCQFCSKAGDYKIWLNGIYVDFSYDFDFGGGSAKKTKAAK
jgi:long-subunit fatty acid transport protein